MNQQVMLRKIQKMQQEMTQTQKEIDGTVFESTSGGVVTVYVFGTKELKEIKIASDFVVESSEDSEMLGEMIVAACKDAYKKIDKTTEEKMSKYQALLGGMGGGLF